MNLVVVESPTKARTLARFLGKDFQVEATMGHIRDLPRNELGVDVENQFQPKYELVPGKGKRVRELKKAAGEAKRLILATDPDREGEAIAWHVLESLRTKKAEIKLPVVRVVFHEITESAIKESFQQPRPVDQQLVDAQQARRILDRLVGYQLSPLLWEKVRYGLSAGRVQSVAVRLVVDRERERLAFVPEESWDLTATFCPQGRPRETFEARLVKIDGQDPRLTTEDRAKQCLTKLANAAWRVTEVKKSARQRAPYPPLTTSTLQRAAAAVFGFPAKKTMSLAQNLYERGLITYHRTDSTHLADSAVAAIRKLIKKEFGEAYLPATKQVYRTKVKVAQEAHEAIRPTQADVREPKLSGQWAQDAQKLYRLIWQNTVACQMKKALYDQTSVEIEPRVKVKEKFLFRAAGSELKFDGWLKVAERAETTEDFLLPELHRDDKLELVEFNKKQKFTQPPPRLTEASLIKALEEKGIGRPSTYAPILTTIQERGYTKKENKQLVPTATGEVVTDLLIDHFGKIIDYDFTAELEEELDQIARGERDWVGVIRGFYQPFAKNLAKKFKEINKAEVVVRRRLDENCPKCGSQLVVKLGRFGEFVSCSTFPDCDYSRPVADNLKTPGDQEKNGEIKAGSQLKEPCPKCSLELVLKEGRFGTFIACSGYPKCKYTRNYQDKIGMNCPECAQGEIIRKKTRRGRQFFGCSRYPDCDWASWDEPKPDQK